MEQERISAADGKPSRGSKERKLKRKEILEKKKSRDQLIKDAYLEKDHLSSFQPFRHYNRNGLSLFLESGNGDKLSSSVKLYIQNLLKVNMEAPFGSEWPTEEKVKRREMVAPEARYIFAIEATNGDCSDLQLTQAEGTSHRHLDRTQSIVGFVHFRFTMEEEIAVLYVYELQLEHRVQGKGLGKFLMQLIELIARKKCMGAVMLTVQNSNLAAMKFYLSKLRYSISSISPSRVYPLLGMESSYEILCKTFDHDAKAMLE